ncbi:phospholipid-transporting ATPase IC [Megalops cyprinoides]|uniref:phospholipid-transporting ATPase IC n=1 Tax=Megalops cyprinoides TaxID=118141 RepID=UPI0018656303|nr:phospholipid-transporting ATPase IC [Megalops cyprinoides]
MTQSEEALSRNPGGTLGANLMRRWMLLKGAVQRKGQTQGGTSFSSDFSTMAKQDPMDSQNMDLSWEVRANDRQFHKRLQRRSVLCFRKGKYADNVVRSYKYSPLTFLPLSLYEQFQRTANVFFLLMVILQCVPAISTLQWYTSMIPLLMVLSVRGLKDLADDLARRRSDTQINRRPCEVLNSQGFSSAQWQDICVGDVLRLHADQIVPADLLLLCSSEPHSLCYVETADIDGETNLKYRQALAITHQELSTDPIEPALLAFNGSDSKILQNCGRLVVKRTQVEIVLNRGVIGIVVFLLLSALLLAVGSGVFESQVSPHSEVLSALRGDHSPAYRAFLTFWGYVILLSPAMPMSLYITFEVIHVFLSLLISWDLDLYEEESETPAQARSTVLNEELGQVGYLLSDKTGTLTQNRLLFRQCCIAGFLYGAMPDTVEKPEFPQPLDLSWNPYSCGGLQFYDQRLVDRLRGQQCPETREFFTALALCHTVMAERREGVLVYQAASPDEGALVGAARDLGCVFLSRTRDSLTLSEQGNTRQYQLLALLDFTSQRRRMSVLVREPEGGLKLYCKGADIVILERLQQNCIHRESTERALELFAQGCLRTLCVAVRSVKEELWEEWSQVLSQVATATRYREDMLEQLYNNMESELTLLGVTAIEDRLQVGVPETINTLRQAGVKVWVLTGDKKETAVNIGYSCSLLDPDTTLLQAEELRQLLQSPDPEISLSKGNESGYWGKDRKREGNRMALVITGPELVEMEEKPDWGKRFVALSKHCQSVLCCRVTPGQKAAVVQLVRKHTSAITMAIGDGANDVNMIKTAHIGVGLSGMEGSQAVQNADYSLAQFRFVGKLLLVHGRWAYRRICIFLRYFLYKTSTFALVHIWFGFYNGFSAQAMYENWFITLYTVMYTILPILSVAVFDQDISAKASMHWPELYQVGQRQELFNPWQLSAAILYSTYTSLVLFFIPLGVFHYSALDYQTFAVTVATAAVFTVTAEVTLQTGFWTKYNAIAVFLSLAMYFVSTVILHSPRLHAAAPTDYYFPGASLNAFANPLLWLITLLTAFTAVLPSLTARALALVLNPMDTHRVHSSDPASSRGTLEMQARFRRGDLHRRSSYAMSQGRGFGRLITSGVGLRSTAPQQGGEQTAGKTSPEPGHKLEQEDTSALRTSR